MSWPALGTILGRVELSWALCGSALTFVMIALLAVRWRLFLGQLEIDIKLPRLFGLTWAGQFFNSILPGSTGGDVVKIYQLCRILPERKAAVAASVLADRLTALVVLLGFAGVSFLVEPLPLQIVLRDRIGTQRIFLVAVGLMIIGLAAAWILWLFLRRTAFAARLGRVLAAVRQCCSLNGRLIAAFFLALALHVVNFSIIFLFARSLGLTITYPEVLLMMPVVLVLVMMPVTINGHGLRELLLIAYLGAMNVTVAGHPEFKTFDTAVALSLLGVANDLLWSVPGGIVYFSTFRRASP